MKAIVIYPTWKDNKWMFDDPRVGLVGEQFVDGVPEMLERLLERADVKRAKIDDFRLKLADHPFDGSQAVWVKKEAHDGGNWYEWETEQMRGWLCAVLNDYFGRAPEQLYLHVRSI